MKEQWEKYMDMGEQMSKEELTKEMLEKQIDTFSSFLSETNSDYYYNATYLPNYVTEFTRFLECFHKKYQCVIQIFVALSSYADVTLTIDRYWQQEIVFDQENKQTLSPIYKLYPAHERQCVCDDGLLIECSVLCGTKRFIYHSKTGIEAIEIQQEIQRLKNFLNSRLSSGTNK